MEKLFEENFVLYITLLGFTEPALDQQPNQQKRCEYFFNQAQNLNAGFVHCTIFSRIFFVMFLIDAMKPNVKKNQFN